MGLAAIGINCDGEPSTDKPKVDNASKVERLTKTSAVLDLLRRQQGATIADLIAATGWLPHTSRSPDL